LNSNFKPPCFKHRKAEKKRKGRGAIFRFSFFCQNVFGFSVLGMKKTKNVLAALYVRVVSFNERESESEK
jgi:hypothetical protein